LDSLCILLAWKSSPEPNSTAKPRASCSLSNGYSTCTAQCQTSFPLFMADLVGLIASVLQLVNTVAKTRDYIQVFRSAPHEQKELVLEVQNLGPLIRKLDERISDDEVHGSDTIIQNFKDPPRQLETMLERLAKKLDSDGIKKFSGRVTWSLWGKEDVNETLGAIERFKAR
ncbi:hypothetical protein DFH08DRAFT_517199, partial [Mycena albidolilacea]